MALLDRLLATFLGWRIDREAERVRVELEAAVAVCVAHAKRSWISMAALPFKDDAPLADVIEAIGIPFQTYVETRYPVLLSRPGMLQTMLWAGIVEAGTHPKQEIDEAFATLIGRYTQ